MVVNLQFTGNKPCLPLTRRRVTAGVRHRVPRDVGRRVASATAVATPAPVPESAPLLQSPDLGVAGGRTSSFDAELALRPGERLYFAYGANMSPAVLAKRKVSPRLSVPCEVPGHYLSFRQRGLPFLEPAFASVLPRPGAAHSLRSAALAPDRIYNFLRRDGETGEDLGPDVHGVLHVLSAADWNTIARTEGVGSTAVGYQAVVVNCLTYSGRSIPAYTLQSHPSGLHPPDAAVVPSDRYMSILREGALHFGCKTAYVNYLRSLPSYSAAGAAVAAGQWAVGGLMMTAVLPALPLIFALQLASTRRSANIH